MPATGHLDENDTAAYISGRVQPAVRAAIEEHLIGCEECREDVFAVRHVLRTARRRRVTRIAVPAALAASVLIVMMSSTDGAGRFETIVRGAAPAKVAPALLAPLDTVSRLDSVRWHAVPGALRYRVVISSEDARPVWRAVVRDTAAAIPESLRFVPLARYYWSVEAETRVGHWEESAPGSFWWNAVSAPR